jgi:ribosomal protein L16/L10AE
MKPEIKTPETFLSDWIKTHSEILNQGWSTTSVCDFAYDYNVHVQQEEEKWFDHKDIEDLMKKVKKYLTKGMIITLRIIAKKQELIVPKHKRK